MNPQTTDLDEAALEAFWADRRSSERHSYPIQQVIAVVLDDRGRPLPQSCLPVKCRDISRGGVSFYWPEPPNFSEIAFYLIRENECSLIATELRHCRPAMLDDRPVFLVGCKFKNKLGEMEVNEQLALARRKAAAHRDGAAALAAVAERSASVAVQTSDRVPIMLVEEQRNSLQGCVDYLETAFPGGVTLIPFEEPSHAVEYLKHHRVDILVTDLRVGDAIGLDLVLALRRRCNVAHCYLLTDNRSPELLSEALEAGVTDFLEKPLNRVEFVHTIRQAIQWQRRWRESLGTEQP